MKVCVRESEKQISVTEGGKTDLKNGRTGRAEEMVQNRGRDITKRIC